LQVAAAVVAQTVLYLHRRVQAVGVVDLEHYLQFL
jgi:hypothetical protein